MGASIQCSGGYRPEVEGSCAIAVAIVVIYHINKACLRGRYVGNLKGGQRFSFRADDGMRATILMFSRSVAELVNDQASRILEVIHSRPLKPVGSTQ